MDRLRSSEAGGVIYWIFIAVALFAAILFSYELFDFGEPVVIDLPAASEVTPFTEEMLFGGATAPATYDITGLETARTGRVPARADWSDAIVRRAEGGLEPFERGEDGLAISALSPEP